MVTSYWTSTRARMPIRSSGCGRGGWPCDTVEDAQAVKIGGSRLEEERFIQRSLQGIQAVGRARGGRGRGKGALTWGTGVAPAGFL